MHGMITEINDRCKNIKICNGALCDMGNDYAEYPMLILHGPGTTTHLWMLDQGVVTYSESNSNCDQVTVDEFMDRVAKLV